MFVCRENNVKERGFNLEQIQLLGHTVLVNKELTQSLYRPLPLLSDKEHCGCINCANYAKACDDFDENVLAFFDQFGVDPF